MPASPLPRGAVLRSGGFEDTGWVATADGAEECLERARNGREDPFQKMPDVVYGVI
jgi:hypothetical protein